MEQFLIVKTSAIGDVVSSFDVLSYLIERFPEAQVDWVVEKASADLLCAHPDLNRVIVCDTKKWRKGLLSHDIRDEIRTFRQELKKEEYDAVFDLQGNSKSALMTAIAKSKVKVGFDARSVAEKPNLLSTNHRFFVSKEAPPRKRYLQLVQAYFEDTSVFSAKPVTLSLTGIEKSRLEEVLPRKGDPLLMVCFGSIWENKRLSKEVLIAFLKKVSEAYSPFFLFPYSHDVEKKQAGELQAAFSDNSDTIGEMSLPFWQALMARMDGVITMDSAALHLCGTTQTPSFSIFGPSNATAYKPEGEQHVALQGPCPYGKAFVHRCPKLRTCPKAPCMRSHAASELFSRFSTWIPILEVSLH